jgi:hypothetical protein
MTTQTSQSWARGQARLLVHSAQNKYGTPMSEGVVADVDIIEIWAWILDSVITKAMKMKMNFITVIVIVIIKVYSASRWKQTDLAFQLRFLLLKDEI